jgi:5'-3' exoribonuclease 2
MRENGIENPELKLGKWDTAAITPGTAFMNKLATALASWKKRIIDDITHPYNRVEIIISDSNQPGEGEHKIFTFI